MSLVDSVVRFITDELNIKISEKKKELIFNKFYPDIKDKFYWNTQVENTIYDSVVSKEEYENIKKLPPDTYIEFAKISKYVYDNGKLKDILPFTDDINEIKKFYDKGGENCNDYFDLMEYFYDQVKLN